MLGPNGAKVSQDVAEAARLVTEGTPVVLVGEDAARLGEAVLASPDEAGHKRLLAVMVGDLSDSSVEAAAAEMASELWPWAAQGGPGRQAPGAQPAQPR
jgi:hypothetical protein